MFCNALVSFERVVADSVLLLRERSAEPEFVLPS